MKKWIEWLEKQESPIKADRIAKILGVTPAEVYKLAAEGKIPGAIRVSGKAIRFCPDIFAEWLKTTIYQAGRKTPAPGSVNGSGGAGLPSNEGTHKK
jgi:predicted DNA-binding transcriptional regulator AlpA